MTEKIEESLSFVARYYRQGAFAARQRFAPIWWRRPAGVAAACAVGILLVGAAVFGVSRLTSADVTPLVPPSTEICSDADALTRIERLEFADASLTDIVAAIETAYGVTIIGVPADGAPDVRLSLSYEGDVAGLVDSINALTGLNLSIEQP